MSQSVLDSLRDTFTLQSILLCVAKPYKTWRETPSNRSLRPNRSPPNQNAEKTKERISTYRDSRCVRVSDYERGRHPLHTRFRQHRNPLCYCAPWAPRDFHTVAPCAAWRAPQHRRLPRRIASTSKSRPGQTDPRTTNTTSTADVRRDMKTYVKRYQNSSESNRQHLTREAEPHGLGCSGANSSGPI